MRISRAQSLVLREQRDQPRPAEGTNSFYSNKLEVLEKSLWWAIFIDVDFGL